MTESFGVEITDDVLPLLQKLLRPALKCPDETVQGR